MNDRSAEDLIATLVSSARELCELSLDSPDSPELFESYAARVDELMAVAGERLQALLSSPTGQAFLRAHADVIERAGAASKQAGAELRGLKRRGKGIMAYTDLLPKRLGTIRPRKG